MLYCPKKSTRQVDCLLIHVLSLKTYAFFRQSDLEKQFRFTCHCSACTPISDGGCWSPDSDANRDKIGKLDTLTCNFIQTGQYQKVRIMSVILS